MVVKKVIAIIESGQDGTYSVCAPELENVIIGSGATMDDAKKDFENSYKEMVDAYIGNGKAVPDELKDVEWEYRYDL